MKRSRFLLAAGAAVFFILFLSQQSFAVEVVLQKGKTIQAKVTQITDKDVKLNLEGVEMTYALSEIKSINGIEDISITKLRELGILGYQYVDQAVAEPGIDDAKCAEGIQLLKKIDELDLPDMRMTSDMIEVTKRCKKHEDSIPYLEKEMKAKTGDAKAHMELANVYRHYGNDKSMMAKAIAEYEKAVAIEGPTAENQYEMGRTYTVYGEFEKAVIHFEKACALNADDADAYSYMGKCYNELGRYEEAATALQKAIELGNKKGRTYHWLSKAYEALGQSEKAAESESKAKQLGYKQGF